MTFHVPEKYRDKLPATHPLRSSAKHGNNGTFTVPLRVGAKGKKRARYTLQVIASDGEGWEHVSVSLPNRTPTWTEMCVVKDLFWDGGDCVMQFHPPKSEYVNFHPHTLHLWRQTGANPVLPPWWLVGPRGSHAHSHKTSR